MPEKIAVALSGGVDSSVTAFLLKEKGYNVVGVTAKTTDSPAAEKVIQNASEVAKKLQIPFYPLDVTDIFKEKVINYFENSYKEMVTFFAKEQKISTKDLEEIIRLIEKQ